MVSAPWEPYPERKRKLEERAKRTKDKNVPQHCQTGKRGRRKHDRPATDSSFSSTSSTDDHAREDGSAAGCGTDSVATSCGSHGSLKDGDGQFRVRPEDCWCLRVGGCGDEDGCCAEDLPGVVVCPCFSRISPAGAFEVRSSAPSGANAFVVKSNPTKHVPRVLCICFSQRRKGEIIFRAQQRIASCGFATHTKVAFGPLVV